jgi:hypothetical protein
VTSCILACVSDASQYAGAASAFDALAAINDIRVVPAPSVRPPKPPVNTTKMNANKENVSANVKENIIGLISEVRHYSRVCQASPKGGSSVKAAHLLRELN